MDELVVTANPLRQGIEELVRPVEILAGAELDARKAGSLGETLANLTGVHSSAFGAGVGRPVIRGQDGPRVRVMAAGLASQDASTVSGDHAIAIEPFLADQIEVLKGPATLLYGSGAIGGAVNVVDGRIPEQVPEQALSGRAELRGNTVSDERTGALRLDGGGGNFAFHADVLRRRSDDYDVPGFAESAQRLAEEGEAPDPDSFGTLENSAVDTDAGSFGVSLIGERGFVGMSWSLFDTRYGVPGHAHAHHEDDDDDHDDDHDGDEEERVRIELESRRTDLKAGLWQPFAGHEVLTWRIARTRYQHIEFEGDDIGTVFENDGVESRLEAVHAPWHGWRGAYGLQYGRRDFSAVGEEAFVPPSLTRDWGLFLLEERAFDALKFEFGGRLDRVNIRAQDARASFTNRSLSAAGRWSFTPQLDLQVGLDRAERAPTSEELFSDGPHVATQSFEIGNAELDRERANRIELGLHFHNDRLDAHAAVYRTHFDDFIFLADTGEEEDDLPVRAWTQADARFNGIEAEAKWLLAETAHGRWDLRLHGDAVRARLDDGDDLPRIPSNRIGAGLSWQHAGWRARLGAVRYAEQDRIAPFESESPGYTLVDAHLSYHFDRGNVGWEVFLDGRNLTDREARPHTSFVKDIAPLPGRAVAFGVRAFF